jgi:uncharacterized protein
MTHYYSYNDFLQKKFGCRVYKVSIDAGFTCPNRDGTKGVHGCIFCDASGSSSRTHGLAVSITNQIINNINVRRSRYGAKKFIAYFQSFTNTYAPVFHLKQVYDEAIQAHEDIVGLAISTRADCIDREKLELIASYQTRVPYVCVEYGLQTIHDHTLNKINRQETHEEFVRALELTQEMGLDHCVHVILGLPGETPQQMIDTAKRIAAYRIQGVKIHFLVAMEQTLLQQQYAAGIWKPLTMDEAVLLTCDFLEHLSPDCIIYRIGGNGHPRHAIAPEWVWQKKRVFNDAINREFNRRNSRQGSKFKIL